MGFQPHCIFLTLLPLVQKKSSKYILFPCTSLTPYPMVAPLGLYPTGKALHWGQTLEACKVALRVP